MSAMTQESSEKTAVRLRIIRLVGSLILLTSIVTWALLIAKRNQGWVQLVAAQGSSTTSAPQSMTTAAPPQNFGVVQPNAQTQASAGRQVFIGFDGLPY